MVHPAPFRDARRISSRYAAFIAANPDWPSAALLRRRAEARLWQEQQRRGHRTRLHGDRPTSAKGKFALARVLLAEGDRDGAARLVRDAWRIGGIVRAQREDALRSVPRPPHQRGPPRAHGQADRRQGLCGRHARRQAARRATRSRSSRPVPRSRARRTRRKDALDDVAAEARARSRLHAVPHAVAAARTSIDDAARVMLAAAPETMAAAGHRRNGGASAACSRASCSTRASSRPPMRWCARRRRPPMTYYRADFHFMCGWIALRYLDDPSDGGDAFRP